tara:strand:+ start:7902 stop:8492 length:591 start_codon:yes stop_codon:yes gene_type:complete
MNKKYNSDNIIISLEVLEEDMQGKKIMWPPELHNYIKTKEDALKVLKNVSQLQNHLHTGWMNYVQDMFDSKQMDSFFWVNTYRHLASVHDVPMSWIACLKIQPVFDHMGSYWRIHSTDFFNTDGSVPDIVYAAWLDGVSDGVFVDEPFLYTRTDENIAMTDMANDFLNDIVKSMEYDSPADFLKQFSHEYDMDIPK